jgi:hypothetical protein
MWHKARLEEQLKDSGFSFYQRELSQIGASIFVFFPAVLTRYATRNEFWKRDQITASLGIDVQLAHDYYGIAVGGLALNFRPTPHTWAPTFIAPRATITSSP